MSNSCNCERDSNYDKKYIVEGFIENFDENEEWWDAMTEYQFDGEIVVLELTNDKFIGNLESQFDLDIDDMKEIGNVKISDWNNLIKIIGENEVSELKKEYNDLDEINWAVILYYDRKFCTIVTSEDPNCI